MSKAASYSETHRSIFYGEPAAALPRQGLEALLTILASMSDVALFLMI